MISRSPFTRDLQEMPYLDVQVVNTRNKAESEGPEKQLITIYNRTWKTKGCSDVFSLHYRYSPITETRTEQTRHLHKAMRKFPNLLQVIRLD
jgi:hypothetical protein